MYSSPHFHIIFGGDIQATGEGVGATLRESRAVEGSSREQRSSASLHSAAAINCPLLLPTTRLCYFLLQPRTTKQHCWPTRESSWQPLVPRIKSGLKTHFLYFAKTCKNKLPKINCRPIWRFPQITRLTCHTNALIAQLRSW